jgi:hypothetical protein
MRLLRKLADTSFVSGRLRRKRSHFFMELLKVIPENPICILDVGGTLSYWQDLDLLGNSKLKITILNLEIEDNHCHNVGSIIGDGRNMYQFGEKEFDLAFSNSVIEHLRSYEDQKQMASEIRRVGKRYFVQTPNYYFPIEPHFFLPCFQFLPISVRVLLIQRINMGWYTKIKDPILARDIVLSIRLLRKDELCSLFPGCKIFQESLFFIPKSFAAYGGWEKTQIPL